MGFKLDLRTARLHLTFDVQARSGHSAGDGGRSAVYVKRGEKIMPLYEYTCTDCEQDFEELVSSSSSPVKCPNCQSEKVEKKFSTFPSSGFSGKADSGSCKQKSGFS